IEENDTLTKYSLNTYDILIFVHFVEELNSGQDAEVVKSIVNKIKATDLTLIENRIEKLRRLLKYKHSENEAAELNSLSNLINSYKSEQKLEFNNLDKISKNAVDAYGLLAFKPLCIFLNTKYKTGIMEFKNMMIAGLDVGIYICDFFLYSELKEECKREPKIFEELGVEYIDYSRIITQLLARCNIYHFYTLVSSDIRAWQIKKGTTAKEAAGKIHKDFERGFIGAEVIRSDDFINYNGDMKKLKSSGKVLQVNQDYQIHDEDIITFRFNV
ncbi:MAG: DUF933 domain-containing protein, partial [Planctomycetota bacterium]